MSKFIIEIRTKGFTQAKKGLADVDDGIKRNKKSTDKLRGSTSGLRRQVGALRNNLLLVTFAFAGVTKALGGFVSASSKFQDVKTRLVGLTGGVKQSEEAFAAFNQVASTTPFMLDDVVNAGAQLEAFGVNSKATLSSVTDLAAFMGTTATEAANALGRAFAGGAGAADILRERGILNIVKDSQKLDDLSKITLPEFRKALLSAMVDPAVGIEGSSKRLSETFNGAVSNMKDSVMRFQATIGDLLLPKLTELVKSTEAFFRAIDGEAIQTFIQGLTALGIAIVAVNAKAIILSGTVINFNRIAKASAVGVLGFLAFKALQATNAFGGLSTSINNTNSTVTLATPNMQQYINTLSGNTVVLEQNVKLEKLMMDLRRGTGLLILENQGLEQGELEMRKNMLNAEQLLIKALGDKISIDTEAIFTQGKLMIGQKDLTSTENEFVNAVMRSLTEQKKQIDINNELTISGKQASSTFISMAQGVKGLASSSMSASQTLGFFLKTIGSLASLAPDGGATGSIFTGLGSLFAHTGGYIGQNGIQRFATGGMVKGQDNVPIMAQAGEFVMKRDAVQNIGLNNLHSLNQGTSIAPSMTVNIGGDIIGDEEHVRTKVLPIIQDEMRRAVNA